MTRLPSKFTGVMLLTAILSTAVHSTPIEIIQTGTGSGQIGSTALTNASFTLTGFSDTSTREPIPLLQDAYIIYNTSSFVTIDGVGSFQILTASAYAVSQPFQTAGYEYHDSPEVPPGYPFLYDLLDGPSDPMFGTWDMTTSIEPISGKGELNQWGINPVQTSGGVLNFIDGFPQVTFQAIVGVPEPTALALICTILIPAA